MRAIWSGTISFGLVSVPVKMITATESKELKFHFLHKDDLTPIGYDKVRKNTGEHVDPEKVIRGFEIEQGRYVELTDEDIDRLDKELLELLRAKAETGVIPERRDDGDEGQVVDLMQALRESVERTKTKRTAARRRKPATKKKKTTKAA